ncbi:hypothetical protein WJW27_004889 [Escherichia coli]
MNRKYRETMKFTKECLEVVDFIFDNKDSLGHHFVITKKEDKRYKCQRLGYSIEFSLMSDGMINSLYECGKTDYISFRSWSDNIMFLSPNGSKYPFLNDLSEESYFQNSLIYTEKELKMLFIMSYFKKYCKFKLLSFEISSMKVFIKNVKELKRFFDVHRK